MINPGELANIDLWLLPLEEDCSVQFTDNEIAHLLDSAEMQRFTRFKVDSKQQEFLASRLLLRHILSRRTSYSNSEISAISAIPDEMGRPFFHLGEKKLPFFFSLSHTKGFVVSASGTIEEIGCDVEHIKVRKYLQQLTNMVFSESECNLYNSLSEAEKLHFFYKSWTLKEAYVKARGQGLRIPLTSLSFTQKLHLKESATVCVTPDTKTQNIGFSEWFFQSLCPASEFIYSLATSITNPKIQVHHLLLNNGVIVEAKKE